MESLKTMIYYIIWENGGGKEIFLTSEEFNIGISNYEAILDFYRDAGYTYFDIEDGSEEEIAIQTAYSEWIKSCETQMNERYNNNGFKYGSRLINSEKVEEYKMKKGLKF